MSDSSRPRLLLTKDLVKLRDLSDNIWNADTQFLLTRTRQQVRELARIAEEEEWDGEVRVVEDQEEIDLALTPDREQAVLPPAGLLRSLDSKLSADRGEFSSYRVTGRHHLPTFLIPTSPPQKTKIE